MRRVRDLSGSPDLRIIGPQGCGKTTFMATLAYWPNARQDSPIESVKPFDDDSGKLIDMAQDILENGLPLAGTLYDVSDPNNLPLYTLLIELKPAFRLLRNIRFQVSCREYAGELIDDLCKKGMANPILDRYLEDCAEASGLLILIDGTAKEDQRYSQAFVNLKAELNLPFSGNENKNRRKSYRIAVVFSKAEQAQVWNYRYKIKQFVDLKFPKTKDCIQQWCREWQCSANYFFCSAFGMINSPPTPNVKVQKREKGGTYGVIAKPKYWRPFGLVAPIYWLHTGIDESRLRKIEE